MASTEATELIIPQKVELVTGDVVKAYVTRLEEMAERELTRRTEEGYVMSPGERELEKHKLMLDYCAVMDNINQRARQLVLEAIHRRRLNEHSPEGWSDLRETIEDAVPSYSGGTRHQLQRVAEVIAPWCEAHNIDIYDSPEALWRVNEAASFIAKIIEGDAPEQQKVADVRRTLDYVTTHNQQEVRAYVRQYKGTPIRAGQAELPDGNSVLVLVGKPAEIRAARMLIGNRATWTHHAQAIDSKGDLRPSKAGKGQLVRDTSTGATLVGMQVFNEDGELIQEVE